MLMVIVVVKADFTQSSGILELHYTSKFDPTVS